jgi:hypothetical protein
MGQILAQYVTGSMRRNMPHAIPAVVLRRLLIDLAWQGERRRRHPRRYTPPPPSCLGDVSARLEVVHAISPAAEAFYLHHGFTKLQYVARPNATCYRGIAFKFVRF